MMSYLFLVIGFLLLIKGADWFVEGASSLAKSLKIPAVIIGLTIVAMGTSAPEASVSLNAALAGNNDIAISNVVGSNIFNQLIVVGMCAVIIPLVTSQDILKRDMPINILISIILGIMIFDGKLSRFEGIVLLVGMVVYILEMIRSALKNRVEEDDLKTMPLYKTLIFIVVGLACVIYGGDLVVNHASLIATSLGLSQNFIGLTIVAVGTSLPELVTSLVATRKGENELALGNVIGSNIFNILFILGLSATVSPLNVLTESLVDTIVLTIVSMGMMWFARTRGEVNKKEGWFCIVLYVVYTIYLFMR